MRNKPITHFVLISALITSQAIEAVPTCKKPIAKIASAQGKVDVRTYDATNWQRIHAKDLLCPGDTLRTLKWSRATLALTSGTVLTVDQNTTMTFSAPVPEESASSWFINLLDGTLFSRSRQPQHLNIQTPFINAVHEGTEFMVTVSSQKAEISVFDGQVSGENSAGKITINKGFKGIAEANRPPRVQALKITPEDAVQWMLYYPPIIEDSQSSKPAINSQVSAVLAAYRLGDSNLALAKLEDISVSQQDPQYLTLKAALLLTVGRVDEAQPLIQQAQHLEPNNSDAFALQAIIAVTKNQQQTSLELANKAVAANSQSSVAKIAQSYAYQSQFNIDEALKATQAATRLNPDNALAWARLSELQLSQGDHDAALKAAQKAQTLNPKIARTQTILGFADLAQTEIEDAKQVFEKALALDSSDPLARLGLGLAKIRQGDLEEGKAELETAVNLDPNNAVTRSYLGKAYYELRNKDYAGKEFEIAKERDPKDPTPYFYDAILKQTTNRPVEALHDMQKAIELNDNRGVYRSKLLLDSDSAARSASLGRIYNDLGFQQRGLLEGWNSVNQDPSNYSAHRLLADNYAALPRHEVSRLSELLKAQLLQPVNITPVQPQAAESNILILDGLGSSITSFNEYNPLFTRDRFALQASGFYGSNDTLSDEVVQSGVWDRFSYSLGQFHYQTDGYRPNNDLDKDVYNVFAQLSLNQDTNIQAELRHSEQRNGDISQDFVPSGNVNFLGRDKIVYVGSSLTRQQQSTNESARAGLHHKFSANSDMLMSLTYNNNIETGSDDDFQLAYVGQNSEQSYSKKTSGLKYELQNLYKSDLFDATIGFGYLAQTNKDILRSPSSLNPSTFDEIKLSNDVEHGNFYAYSDFKNIPNLIATLGVTQDFYDIKGSFNFNTNPINPKFGLTWFPAKNTTVRFAAFTALKRTRLENQSLEPTQVAGFNQFFDDLDGTYSQRIGLGIDHKISKSAFIGVEGSTRSLQVPQRLVDLDTGGLKYSQTHWYENSVRGYFNWTPNDYFALSANYLFEEFDRGRYEAFDQISSYGYNGSWSYLKTHKTEFAGNFFHPSGFIGKLKLTYIDQSGEFKDSITRFPLVQVYPGISQNSNFWTLDTEIGYRLFNRHGLLVLGIKNILDEKFNFQGTDFNQPGLQQGGRFLYSRLTLSF
ncbi:tetratricopeptide repeat protein [Methyloglobulus sp.]|uniref:tetratricopeptide repeat protein n=1 Tax=Methyloglobulus sp. TaxID=2518622 RepID=UPI0032B7B13B